MVGALVAGCAARHPVLYPTEQLPGAGSVAAERGIEECEQLAEGYDARGAGQAVARDTAIGGGTGAAVGAVTGAIYGDAGSGAAAGAAGGATAGLLHALLRAGTPSDTYKSYVTACLQDRGYRVIGWE